MSTKPAKPTTGRKFSFRPTKDGHKEATIAVMGCTGSGKTTFVNLASKSHLRVGAGLESCTDTIQKSQPFELDGYTVTLVDTPGFDDTNKSEVEILTMICDYLREEYAHRRCLRGVIYLHRISDNRVGGTALQNIRFFHRLCGDKALKNSVVITNMWNQVTSEVGTSRETELKSKDIFFKPAIDKGAAMLRHDNTIESAHNAIRHMLHNKPMPLAIQVELVTDKKPIYETEAGQTLLGEMATREQKHQRELEALKKELEEAKRDHDTEAMQDIEEARLRLDAEVGQLIDERQRLLGPDAEGARERRKLSWMRRVVLPFVHLRASVFGICCTGFVFTCLFSIYQWRSAWTHPLAIIQTGFAEGGPSLDEIP
ncbi:P-loop containing nucleoside triphosphate hydrolase protein [Cristinia sonorae]|uniref:P-loop containing nucleoside triphosphate hydrolase protein n=1 Tax=Cristinia sonorae TaxID=1940300 RepID=A0A8K0UF31_9AGAR|nr:P-loop containing nucleoside triphosphate hydrolase protein [Cristinia sonorae]